MRATSVRQRPRLAVARFSHAALVRLFLLAVAFVACADATGCGMGAISGTSPCPSTIAGQWVGSENSPTVNPRTFVDIISLVMDSSTKEAVATFDDARGAVTYKLRCLVLPHRIKLDFLDSDSAVVYRGTALLSYGHTAMTVFLHSEEACTRVESDNPYILRNSSHFEWSLRAYNSMYVGCFPENAVNPLLMIDSLFLSVRVCTARCGALGFDFAGMLDGVTCLCLDESPGGSARVATSHCLLTGAKTASDFGGLGYTAVVTTQDYVEGLTVEHDSVVEYGVAQAQLLLPARPAAFRLVEVYYGDGASDVVDDADQMDDITLSHTYATTGSYEVLVMAHTTSASLTRTSIYIGRITVIVRPSNPVLSLLANQFVVGVPTTLSYYLSSGTAVQAELSYDGATLAKNIMDSPVSTVGVGPSARCNTNAGSLMTFIVTDAIQDDGFLTSWSLRAAGSGLVYLQVWRRVCPDETPYLCTNWNGPGSSAVCVVAEEDCVQVQSTCTASTYCASAKVCADPREPVCGMSCSSGYTYCPRTMECRINGYTCGPTSGGPFLLELVGQSQVTSNAGFNEVYTENLDPIYHISVKAGDLIGFTHTSTAVVRAYNDPFYTEPGAYVVIADIDSVTEIGVRVSVNPGNAAAVGLGLSATIASPRAGGLSFIPTGKGTNLEATLRVFNDLTSRLATIVYSAAVAFDSLSEPALDSSASGFAYIATTLAGGAGANFTASFAVEGDPAGIVDVQDCPAASCDQGQGVCVNPSLSCVDSAVDCFASDEAAAAMCIDGDVVLVLRYSARVTGTFLVSVTATNLLVDDNTVSASAYVDIEASLTTVSVGVAGYVRMGSPANVTVSTDAVGDVTIYWTFTHQSGYEETFEVDDVDAASLQPFQFTPSRSGTWTARAYVTQGDVNAESTSSFTAVETLSGLEVDDVVHVGVGDTVNLLFEATGSFISYTWSFTGPADVQRTEYEGTVVFTQAGDYVATVTLTNPLGDSETAEMVVRADEYLPTGYGAMFAQRRDTMTVDFFFAYDTGTSVKVIVSWGIDGEDPVAYTIEDGIRSGSVSKTFGSPGAYNLAYRLISNVNTTDPYHTWNNFYVEEPVSNLVNSLGPAAAAAINTDVTISTAVSTGTPVYYSFDWGDGVSSSGTETLATHRYTLHGYYIINVTAFNNISAVWLQFPIVILDPVVGAYAPYNGDVVLRTNAPSTFLVSIALGDYVRYSFDWGDGSDSTDVAEGAATHAYTAPGRFSITVTVYNNVSFDYAYISAHVESPVLGLTSSYVNAVPVAVGNPFNFEVSTTSGSDLLYIWNWGDGSAPVNGTDPSQSHAYNSVGMWAINVTAGNDVSTESTYIVVRSYEAVSGASMAYDNPLSIAVNEPFAFSVSVITGSDLLYTWDWGDGETSVDVGATASHTFTSARLYNVVVTAHNNVSTSTASVAVSVMERVGGLTANYPFPVSVPLNEATTFAVSLTGGTNTTFVWVYGDGENDVVVGSSSVTPLTFGAIGFRYLNVTVYNNISSETVLVGVSVMERITNLTVPYGNPRSLPQNVGISHAAHISTGTDVTYRWDWGDGSVSENYTNVSPAHTYTQLGVVSVNVTAYNNISAVSLVYAVSVIQRIGVMTAAYPSLVSLPLNTALSFVVSIPSGTNVTFTWDWGDNTTTTSTHNVETHAYTAVGLYTINVAASNNISHSSKEIFVSAIEKVSGLTFPYEFPLALSMGVSFTFSASLAAGTNVTYRWDFGDGTVLDPANGTLGHVYHAVTQGIIYMNVTAYNNVSSVWTLVGVTVSQRITGTALTFASPKLAVRGVPTVFAATLLSGSDVTFRWFWGDGSAAESVSTLAVNHTYADVGYYVGNVTAYNNVTLQMVIFSVSVLNKVSGLSSGYGDVLSIRRNVPFTFNVSIDAGTNVTYGFAWADGSELTTVSTPSATHTYATVGVRYVNVSAVNSVSSESIAIAVSVLEPVERLAPSVAGVLYAAKGAFFPLSVTLGEGTAVSYLFDFGDGTDALQSESPSVLHAFASVGVFVVNVTASNNISAASAKMPVSVMERVTIALLGGEVMARVATPYAFSVALLSGTNLTFLWDFGDGETATTDVPSATHTYAQSGLYSANVTASNNVSRAFLTMDAVVQVPVSGLFALEGVVNVAHGHVAAVEVGLAEGTEPSFRWNWGDNTTDSKTESVRASHMYENPGTYSVNVTAYNFVSETQITFTVHVMVPVSSLTVLQGPAPEATTGFALILNARIVEGTDVTYRFDWGDGTSADESSSPDAAHAFTEIGMYLVTVTASNAISTESTTLSVNVFDAISGMRAVVTPAFCALGDAVNLTVTIATGTDVGVDVRWGDGFSDPSTSLFSTHQYESVGDFNITVEVVNPVSSAATYLLAHVEERIRGVSVSRPDFDTVIPLVPYTLSVTADGTRPRFTYTFSDGAVFSDVATVTRSVGEEGPFGWQWARVTAANNVSAVSLVWNFFVVVPISSVDIGVAPPVVALGDPVLVTATVGAGSNVSYVVNFGDGEIGATRAVVKDVAHIYGAQGTYEILVTASNLAGQLQSRQTVAVERRVDPVTADVSGRIIALNTTATFTVSAVDATTTHCVWEFGDDEEATGFVVSHLYRAAGNYDVTVTCSNRVSSSNDTLSVAVIEPFVGQIATIPTVAAGDSWPITVTVSAGHVESFLFEVDGDEASPFLTNSPFHVVLFSTAGVYNVKVTVTTPFETRVLRAVAVVEERISGLSVSYPNTIDVGVPVTMQATIATGTNVTYDWSFDDAEGGKVSGQKPERTFFSVAHVHGSVTASNDVSAVTVRFEFDAGSPPTSLSVGVGSPSQTTAFVQVGSRALVFAEVAKGGPNIVYTIDWGDLTTPNVLGNNASVFGLSHAYSNPGQYVVTVNASNPIGSASARAAFVVEDAIKSVTLTCNGTSGQPGVPAQCNAVVSGVAGVFAWFVNGKKYVNTTVPNTLVLFTKIDLYNVSVIAYNNVSSRSAWAGFQIPPYPPLLTLSPIQAVATGSIVNIAVVKDSSLQSVPNVFFSYDYGDKSGSAPSTAMTQTHVYETAGSYNVTVSLYDFAGFVFAALTYTVLVETRVGQAAIATPTSVTIGLPVSFTATTTGTNLRFAWSFANGSPATSTAQSPTVAFLRPGPAAVNLTVFNDISSQSVSTTVQAASFFLGFVSPSASPDVTRRTVRLPLFIAPAPVTLYVAVDWGDGDVPTLRTLPPVTQKEEGPGVTPYNVELAHSYLVDGAFTAKVSILGGLGVNATHTTSASVVALSQTSVCVQWAKSPGCVSLKLTNTGPTLPNSVITFDAKASLPANFTFELPAERAFSESGRETTASGVSLSGTFASEGSYVISAVASNAVSAARTQTVAFVQTAPCFPPVLSIAVASNTFLRSVGFALTASAKTNCTSSNRLRYEWRVTNAAGDTVKLNGATGLQTLTILARSLPAGTVRVEVYGEMVGSSPLVYATTFTYVTIVGSPLVARIAGGTSRTVPWDTAFALNAASSSDPDDPSTQLLYKWSCTPIDQEAAGSCFGDDSVLSDNGRSAQLSVPPAALTSVGSYLFGVNVTTADGRSASTSTIVVAVAGSPPIVSVDCTGDCPEKASPNTRLRLRAVCSANCGTKQVQPTYRWFVNDGKGQPRRVDLQGTAFSVTGASSDTFVVRENVLIPGETYVFGVRVTLAGATGTAQLAKVVNTPPIVGGCLISPTEGVVLSTQFVITCDNFTDDPTDMPLTYTFSYTSGGKTVSFSRTQKNTASTFLPVGDSSRNYTVDLAVTVEDRFGAQTDPTPLRAVVKELSVANSFSTLTNLAVGNSSQLTQLVQSGSTDDAVGLVSVAVSVLTSVAASNSTEVDANQRADLRTALLQGVQSITQVVQSADESQINQFANLISQVTSNPDELTGSGQTAAIDSIAKLSLAGINGLTDNTANLLADGISNVLSANLVRYVVRTGPNPNTRRRREAAATQRIVADKTTAAVDSMSVGILSNREPGEDVSIKTEIMEIVATKHGADDLGDSYTSSGAAVSLPANSSALFGGVSYDTVDASLVSFKTNPFDFAATASGLGPWIISYTLFGPAGVHLNVSGVADPIVLVIPRPTNDKDFDGNKTIPASSRVKHTFWAPSSYHGSSWGVWLRPVKRADAQQADQQKANATDSALLVKAYVAHGRQPSATDNDQMATVDLSPSRPYSDSDPASFIITVPGEGEWQMVLDNTANAVAVEYSYAVVRLSCRFWSAKAQAWLTDGCTVSEESAYNATVCLCDHLTSFAGEFVVAPNKIDLIDDAVAFTHLADNPVCFAMIMTAFGIYIIAVIIARRYDNLDRIRVGFLPPRDDRTPKDWHKYEVAIHTSSRPGSGTDCRVSIALFGENGSSATRCLDTGLVKHFERGAVDRFLVSTRNDLGDLTKVRLGLDRSGTKRTWNVDRVIVRNKATGMVWYFLCNGWMSSAGLEVNERAIRDVPRSTEEKYNRFTTRIIYNTKSDFSDQHLWFSVYGKPERSRFTRVQRITCCLSLLLSVMAVNMAFYETSRTDTSEAFAFSAQDVYVGVVSGLIAFPINIFFVFLFRNSKVKQATMKVAPAPDAAATGPAPPPPAFDAMESLPDAKRGKRGSVLDNWRDFLVNDGAGAATGNGSNGHSAAGAGGPAEPTSPLKMAAAPALHEPVMLERKTAWQSVQEWYEPTRKLDPTHISTLQNSQVEAEHRVDPIVVSYYRRRIRKFPHWVVYIAYTGCYLVSAFAAYVIVLYGFSFGREKATAWVRSIMFSLLESLLLTQPLKVLFLAFFAAIVIKRDKHTVRMDFGSLADLHSRAVVVSAAAKKKLSEMNRSLTSLLDENQVKERTPKEKFYLRVLRELCVYAAVLVLLLVLIYIDRGMQPYHVNKAFSESLVTTEINGSSFMEISSQEEFFDWASNVLVPTINGDDYHKPLENFNAKLLGVARFRQLRVREGTCVVNKHFRDKVSTCRGPFNSDNEDVAPFGGPNHTSFVYTPQKFNGGSSFWGGLTTYHGGGFIVNLGPTYDQSTDIVSNMRQNLFLDGYTRAVFVEFTAYNANADVFLVATLLVEFPPSGGAHPSYEIMSTTLLLYKTPTDYLVLFFELCFVIAVGVRFALQVRGVRREGFFPYFRDIANIADLVVNLLYVVAIIMFGVRFYQARKALDAYRRNPLSFPDFRTASYADAVCEIVLAFSLFCTVLLLFRFLRHTKELRLIIRAFAVAGRDLFQYTFMFFIVFMAYAQVGFLLFGRTLPEYRSVGQAIFTQLNIILGVFQIDELMTQYRLLGPLYFVSFNSIVLFVGFTVFIAILIETYTIIYIRDSAQNEDGIFQIVVKFIREVMGERPVEGAQDSADTVGTFAKETIGDADHQDAPNTPPAVAALRKPPEPDGASSAPPKKKVKKRKSVAKGDATSPRRTPSDPAIPEVDSASLKTASSSEVPETVEGRLDRILSRLDSAEQRMNSIVSR